MTTLHALATDTTFHAEQTAGERNTGYYLFYLLDQDGNNLADQDGNRLVAYALSGAIVMHAQKTDMTFHAEE